MSFDTRKANQSRTQIATYSSMCETLSVPNFHGAGKSSFDAFVNSSPLSQSDFRTTRTTSPKYFPLMYFSNLFFCERGNVRERKPIEHFRKGTIAMAHNQEHKTFIYNFALIYNSLPVQRRAIIVTIMLTKGGGDIDESLRRDSYRGRIGASGFGRVLTR